MAWRENSSTNRILEPCQNITLDCHHVEPAGWRHFKTSQINLCSQDQPGLLGRRDAGCCAAVPAVGALADFNEYERTMLLHYQVDFAALAAKIPFQQRQALLF